VPEPHDTPDDYTINVEVWRDSLWLSIQDGAEETRSHSSQRSETCSRNLCGVQNRTRIMRNGITHTNGNERRKHDENRNKNIDEQKPPYQIINDKPEHLRRLCNETNTLLHTSSRTSRTNGHRWKKSGEHYRLYKFVNFSF
jgi:hypothetical protein